jgi:hypothetical protein
MLPLACHEPHAWRFGRERGKTAASAKLQTMVRFDHAFFEDRYGHPGPNLIDIAFAGHGKQDQKDKKQPCQLADRKANRQPTHQGSTGQLHDDLSI